LSVEPRAALYSSGVTRFWSCAHSSLERADNNCVDDGAGDCTGLYMRRGFNDKRQETWPGLLGRAINKYKDRVIETTTRDGLRRVKLRTDRNSGGAVKWLGLLPPAARPTILFTAVCEVGTAVADRPLYDRRTCGA
jgi:hypothetical protein